MIFLRGSVFKVITIGFVLVIYTNISRAADTLVPSTASDSVNMYLDNAIKALKNEDRDTAITELVNAIKEQQVLIEQMNSTHLSKAPVSANNQTTENNDTFLKQLTKALPLVGGNYGDAEEQWRKAYKLQHKGIFDLTRRDAIPVFKEAIKEYRVVVEKYPTNKRAPQAQRQIAWLYQSQLKDNKKAREEWNKLLQLFPKSEYTAEARREIADLSEDNEH